MKAFFLVGARITIEGCLSLALFIVKKIQFLFTVSKTEINLSLTRSTRHVNPPLENFSKWRF